MSTNVHLYLSVRGVPAGDLPATVNAVTDVLRKHNIAAEVVLTTDDDSITGRTEPYPVIVSRFSGAWVDEITADLTAAVHGVVPGATCYVGADFPDLED